MIEMYAVAAVALIAVGIVAGFLAIFALGARHDDRAYSPGRASPSRIASAMQVSASAYTTHPQLPGFGGRPGASLFLSAED